MADFYKDIEARITAYMQSPQRQQARLHTARRDGMHKNFAYYSEAAKMFQSQREHPLQYNSQFRFVERVKQFGNVPLYNVATKVTSEILCKKQRVPHTDVYYTEMMDMTSDSPDVVGIVWVRRMPRTQIELAVATLLMMGKDVVILRAFTP